jgi:uncharacterized protein (DUF3084 family)
MKLFKRKEETALVVKENPIVVSVPDIKEYLVREYNRVNSLVSEKEKLEEELKIAEEIKIKYEATLVTLDEYAKRLKNAESKIESEKNNAERIKNILNATRDELNSYKIKFNDLALTKEAMKDEIVFEFKDKLVERFNSVKGNLSKSIVALIINETQLDPTEKGEGK